MVVTSLVLDTGFAAVAHAAHAGFRHLVAQRSAFGHESALGEAIPGSPGPSERKGAGCLDQMDGLGVVCEGLGEQCLDGHSIRGSS